MDDLSFIRTLRTPHSERYLIKQGASEIAAADIHFRLGGGADATLILFEPSGVPEASIGELLTAIDELILPDMSLSEKNISFTVVIGRVVGAFSPEQQ